MIKMIVVDLDGTILNNDSKVTNSTIEYLKKLKDDGYIITIATGRILSSALGATDGASFANFIITSNGSCVYNLQTSSFLFENYIDEETIKSCFNLYDDNYRCIKFCSKDRVYKYSEDSTYNEITDKEKEYIINNENISNIAINIKNINLIKQIYSDIVNKLKNVEVVTMRDSFSDKKWFDVMPINCSKYNMIDKLASYLGIKNEEIIAFGDGLNDIDMIKRCGYGVALENALEEVKEVADDVTQLDHNNDGVINYLMEYLYDKEA